jgi:hypothetical protein
MEPITVVIASTLPGTLHAAVGDTTGRTVSAPPKRKLDNRQIAEREVQGERRIRLLVPLAFLSPRIVAAIVDGTAPTDLTVTGLAKALPYSLGEQEQRFSL